MIKGEYIKMGGGSFHLPSIFLLGKDAFLSFYMCRCSFIKTERERLIYLTEVWKQAEAHCKKTVKKQPIDAGATDPETLYNTIEIVKATGRSKARKNGVSKE